MTKDTDFWLPDEDFDPELLDSGMRTNPWDYWVGSQPPAEFMRMSATTDVEAAVESYLDEMPGTFPEASRTVSWDWLYTRLVRYIRAEYP
jgi:hypothetical protein